MTPGSWLIGKLRALWKVDVHRSVAPLRREVRRLVAENRQLRMLLDRTVEDIAGVKRSAERTRFVVRLNQRQRRDLERLPQTLDAARSAAFVRDAIGRSTLHLDPQPHIVVDRLFPDAVYRMLLRAIPPEVFFGVRDRFKQNIRVPIEFAPALSEQVWRFVDETIARDVIHGAVVEKFREPLFRHYESLFGADMRDRAARLPQAVSGGRLMLRRPGYSLAPHRDPKRSMLTCLLYLARPGENEEHGTGLYRVTDDIEPSFVETFYPGEHGLACELVKTVPYRANSMLVFLNSRGAHGAGIPAETSAEFERYAFQFYVGPDAVALEALVAELPPERRAMWTRKKQRV